MAWVNPFYNRANTVAGGGNVRYDHTQPGAGIPGAETFDDGLALYNQYRNSRDKNTVYDDSAAWLTKKGFDPDNPTAQQAFTAVDAVFRDRQRGNKKENFGFDDIAGFIGPAVGLATGQPWLAAAAGGLAQGAASGFDPVQTLLGAGSGYIAGSSNLFGADGFLGPQPGSLVNFAKGAAQKVGLNTFGAPIVDHGINATLTAATNGGVVPIYRAGQLVNAATGTAAAVAGKAVEGAKAVVTGKSVGEKLKKYISPALTAGATVAGLAGAAAGTSNSPAPRTRNTTDTVASTTTNIVEPNVEAGRDAARRAALNADGASDTQRTGPSGLKTKPKLRRKTLLGG